MKNLHTFTEEDEQTEEDADDHLWWLQPQLDWSPEPLQEDPGPVCGERLPPRSRHACDAPGRHLPPLHHQGPLPLHGVAALGLKVSEVLVQILII